jgi:hypothetical protein
MKQTAVQWFASKVMTLNISPKEMHDFLEWFEEAKLLEQEQIREAHFTGSGNNSFEALSIKEKDVSDSYENARRYYKETYE